MDDDEIPYRTGSFESIMGSHNLFAEKFSSFYNPVGYCKSDMKSPQNNIDILINDKCCKPSMSGHSHLHSVDTEQVQEAVTKLKLGKSDGTSEIYSNGIIYGTEHLFYYLSLLFTCKLRHGCTSLNQSQSSDQQEMVSKLQARQKLKILEQ